MTRIIAQIPTQTFKEGMAFEKYPKLMLSKDKSPLKKMPHFDITPLLEEDEAIEGLDFPFRFGKSIDVNISLNDGKWQSTDSINTWSLQILSKGAYSLNFIFSELYVPEGGEMYIFNEKGSMIFGPITSKQNNHGKTFLSDIIQGESILFQASIPKKTEEKFSLRISKVIHGYKNIFAPVLDPGYGQSQNCTKDVICYNQWSDESDGVVQILLASGNELCTGALLNNTAQDFKPFILTAYHCIDVGDLSIQNDTARQSGFLDNDEINQAEEWMVRFRFRHTTCGGSMIASGYTYDDTHFRAAWYETDFALVELDDNIVNDIFSVGQKVWLGWDRTGNTPSSGVGIHHPSGDIMKLSVEDDQFTTSTWPNGLNNSHWLVNFDDGVVEHASSGSPIFDQNQRVVGQLSGNQNYNKNQSYCIQPRAEYGKFDLSWSHTGGNSTNQLSNWLQPTGSGNTLNSIRQPIPQYSGGVDPLCSTTSFSVANLAPGYSIHHWNGSNVSFPNGNTSNPVNVSPGATDDQGWVEAVISTGGGNYTMPRKYFWVNAPDISNIVLSGEQNICPDDYNTITAYSSVDMGVSDYIWDLPSGFNIISGQGTNSVYFYAPSSFSSSDELILEIENSCGYDDDVFEFYEGYDCGGYFLMMSPNPSTSETTLTIGTTEGTETIGDTNEWEMEIYTPSQSLKEKKAKLRGSSTKIQTLGWKEGVYMVRVKLNDTVLTGKLVVK